MDKHKKISGLGKGLEALLPSSIKFTDKGFKFENPDDKEQGIILMVDVHKITHNPYQPRKDFDVQALEDLKNSILEHGVIQPITVRRGVNGYELIAGERRLRAVIAAGIEKIPAYVMDIESDVQLLAIALIENVQRENLNPIEIANGYFRLIEECNLTQEQVAVKVGKERSTVTNFLRLLKLPEKIQESVRKREISMGHARALLALSDEKSLTYVWQQILENTLSVRDTEKLVRNIENGILTIENSEAVVKSPAKKEEKQVVSPETVAILNDQEKQLRHIFGTQVKINPKNEDSGLIQIEFYSKDDLERILELFDIIKNKQAE